MNIVMLEPIILVHVLWRNKIFEAIFSFLLSLLSGNKYFMDVSALNRRTDTLLYAVII